MSHPLSLLSATELLDGYRNQSFSPVEVLEAALRRIDEVQPRLNAFTEVDAERGLAMARQSEQRWLKGQPLGLLDGIPVPVKDTSAIQGWPTRFGSLSQRNAEPASEDAPLVQRLRDNGAVFFCKTATPEFAWKGVTDSAASGVTRNPWDATTTPGGSSGGSAVAVATGVAPMATGADGGGSLRIPASFAGVYGLKPTAGLVPGLPTALGTLAVVGGLTRNAEDAALFLQAVTAPDTRDTYAAPYQDKPYLQHIHGDLRGVRIGLSLDLGFNNTDPEVASSVLAAAEVFRALGATVDLVDLRANDMRETFRVLWALGFSEILGRLSASEVEQVEPALKEQLDRARGVSGLDAQTAQRMCRVFSTRLRDFFASFDLLLTPTVPIPAFAAGALTPDAAAFPDWWDWTPLTWPFNLSRNPAASCPCGLTASGLPIGIQLVGRWFDESTILKASHAFLTARPFGRPVLDIGSP